MRVGFISGPADAPGAYAEHQGHAEASYFGTNYFRQFLQLVEESNGEAWVETWHGAKAYRTTAGPFTFNNVPLPTSGGVRYHLGMIGRQVRSMLRMLRYRPSVLLLTGAQDYWWVYAPLKLLGVRFVASFHCVIWTPYQKPKAHLRALVALNRWIAYPLLDAAVVTSGQIRRQLRQLAPNVPIYDHLPTYDPKQFEGVASPPKGAPFRVMFAGRIEADKGALDMVEVARQLKETRPGEFVFEVCGDGGALATMKQSAPSNMIFHGYCEPPAMRDAMSRCHVCVVPTRSDFPAGFEMTCSEAVLSGRPLVTSAVSPALESLSAAAVEVEPDNLAQYREAITLLADDPAVYASKRDACSPLQAQFYNSANGWLAAMRQAVTPPIRVSAIFRPLENEWRRELTRMPAPPRY